MSDQSDRWNEEIESLAKENSAAVLSVVLGITRGEAADRLLEQRPIPVGALPGFSQMIDMAKILGTELHTASRINPKRVDERSGVDFTDKFPTTIQWLAMNPDRLAILRAGANFIYVGSGIVLTTDRAMSSQKKVTHVIYLDEEGE